LDWQGDAKYLLLITDAPCHGTDFHDLKVSDSYPSHSAESYAKFQRAFEAAAQQDVRVIHVMLNHEATRLMHQRMSEIVAQVATILPERALSCIQLPTQPGAVRHPHIVFCLDESGSMQGQPWDDLISAFGVFWRTRADTQCVGEIVSVVQFSSDARLTASAMSLQGEPPHLDYAGGGTSFVPALNCARAVIQNYIHGYDPIIIFMTDGCASDLDEAAELMGSIASEFGSHGFQAYSVPFGSGADGNVKRLAVPRSNFHTAVTGNELSDVFGSIANAMGLQEASKQIYTRVAGAITSKVQDKLVHDFL